ncbi:A24 family peptidase [Massilia sp. S19_KUP03_FR1]|uniref:A24 family peptidase n=1 Tax=Massilia sp. S19_KUP03_FR1 TaxID=3025503 RepID=UPI002FCD6D60
MLELTLLALVIAAAAVDLARRRIPNLLLLTGWAAALPLHLLSPQPGLLSALSGALCGLMAFLPLYLLRGMAAGDVKMMATVGLFVGPYDALQVAVITCCVGGVMAVAIIVGRGRARHALANVGGLLKPILMRVCGMPAAAEPMRHPSVGGMPYGLAIAIATMWLLFMRHN